jgi:hypothetical protein
MSLIYLASPYSKYSGGLQEAFERVVKKAGELMLLGYKVFCPIAHTHHIQATIGDIGADGWLEQDFAVLERCDELWVYKMPGWENSYGVQKEIERANVLGIPITFIKDD